MTQLTIFDVLPEEPKRLKVGDRIGRIILGEVEIGTIEAIEGNDTKWFYRTNHGCYTAEDGKRRIDDLYQEAEKARQHYKTVEPHNLEKRVTIEFAPRECDGKVLWAQIGIYDGMLFWKEGMTYQFCEPYKNEKELMKAYNAKLAEIELRDQTEQVRERNPFRYVEEEHPMERLYWSNSKKCYASARFKQYNF